MRLRFLCLMTVGFVSSAAAAQGGDLPWLKPSPQPAPANGGDLPWAKGNAAPVQTAPAKGDLPWAKGGAPAPSPMPQAQGNMVSDPATLELDDRKLNDLATQYYAISTKSKDAVSRLTTLQRRVKEFRQALASRAYDSSEIEKDLKGLEGRIAAAKKKAQAQQAAAKAVSAATATPTAAKADDASGTAVKK